jgi:hypothetical protein
VLLCAGGGGLLLLKLQLASPSRGRTINITRRIQKSSLMRSRCRGFAIQLHLTTPCGIRCTRKDDIPATEFDTVSHVMYCRRTDAASRRLCAAAEVKPIYRKLLRCAGRRGVADRTGTAPHSVHWPITLAVRCNGTGRPEESLVMPQLSLERE